MAATADHIATGVRVHRSRPTQYRRHYVRRYGLLRNIGCYGGEIRTPQLDALAARGLRFTQFYNSARCCPTRASLLSGVYRHQAGVGLITGDSGLPGYRGELGRNVMTIAEVLRLGGYRTYIAGKWIGNLCATMKPENLPGFDRGNSTT
ncbi:MAG: sulfatase-like hydrolase/transferase [Pirellulaceae bacterium]